MARHAGDYYEMYICRSLVCRVSASRTPSMTRGVLACGSCVDQPGSMAAWMRRAPAAGTDMEYGAPSKYMRESGSS